MVYATRNPFALSLGILSPAQRSPLALAPILAAALAWPHATAGCIASTSDRDYMRSPTSEADDDGIDAEDDADDDSWLDDDDDDDDDDDYDSELDDLDEDDDDWFDDDDEDDDDSEIWDDDE